MNRNLILALFSLLLIGLISSCSKDSDVAPVSPIVGQWDIITYTVAGIPNSFTSTTNRNGTFTTNLGTDTYEFKTDGTYTNTIGQTASTNLVENGTWVLSGTTVNLTPKGQTSSYPLLYSASTNELTLGPISSTPSVTNPTTGAATTFTYTEVYVYKKKV